VPRPEDSSASWKSVWRRVAVPRQLLAPYVLGVVGSATSVAEARSLVAGGVHPRLVPLGTSSAAGIDRASGAP
jgi:hypothetical protein